MNSQKSKKTKMPDIKPKIVPLSRANPGVRALDSVKWTYSGWENDKVNAEAFYYDDPTRFNDTLAAMQRKQRVHDGDRSDLQELDSIQWNYPGWQRDKKKAEDTYYIYPSVLNQRVETLRRKQRAHDGGKSEPLLRTLEQPQWAYPGWENDKVNAEAFYYDDPTRFNDTLAAMQRKQRVHDGDRSDLQELDSIQWNYPGWQRDKKKAEDTYYIYPSVLNQRVETLRRKQRAHDGGKSEPLLRTLEQPQWAYPGWENDKVNAEAFYYDDPMRFNDTLAAMQRKQRVHDGDRSDLQELDSIQWNYPGWQRDKKKAEDTYYIYPSVLKQRVETLRRKQMVYEGSSRHCPIVINENYPGKTTCEQAPQAQKKRRVGTNYVSRLPREDNSSKCVVCLKVDATHRLKPCNHSCVCASCSNWVTRQKKCPICQLPVASSVKACTPPASAATKKALVVDLTAGKENN